MTQTGCSEEVYGHLHLGFIFFPLLSIDMRGLTYRGKQYSWSEIVSVSETAPGMAFVVGYPLGKPRARVVLRDGTTIKIDAGSFCKKGERPRNRFVSGRSQALDGFLEAVERHVGRKPPF
jgi:hypothetical protein